MAIAQVFRGLPGGTALNMPPFAQVPPHRIPQDRDVVIVSSIGDKKEKGLRKRAQNSHN